MIPTDIQLLPALPRLANGKLDRDALLALQRRRPRMPYAAPRGHTENVLTTLWEALLGIEYVGRDDDFFALGGHSLLAVRLVHRIQATLHADVAVSAVFQHPTPAALAAHLDVGIHRGALICLRPGTGSHAPLFCLHEPSGGVHHYLPLVERLPADQTVHGIPLPAGRNAENSTLTELATDYLVQIRAVQPHGPYHLCGWSMGGLLALELCHQLEQQGERVAFLALFDTTFEAADQPLLFDELLALYRAELTPESAARLDTLPAETLQALHAATSDRGRLAQLRHLLLEWSPRMGLVLDTPVDIVRLVLGTMHGAHRWVSRHRPSTVAADLHMWWAEDTLMRHPGLAQAWEALSRGQLHHVTVSGDHDRILQQPELHASFCAALVRATGGRP